MKIRRLDRATLSTNTCDSIARRRFIGRVVGCLSALLLIVLATGLMAAAPEPEPTPRRWQLDCDPGSLRVVTVQVPGVGPRVFAYLTYRVTNISKEDVFFAPSFELSTGHGDIVRSGRDVPQTVTTEIIKQAQNPFLQDQIQIIGELLQGAEHAKEGVAIWRLEDMQPEQLVVYAAGFSGESKGVSSPDGKKTFVLRKTLQLSYETPGALSGLHGRDLGLTGRTWIMR